MRSSWLCSENELLSGVPLTVALEGPTDQAVVERLLAWLGLDLGKIVLCGGKGKLDKRPSAYNQAARHAPWLVLRDLDQDAPCAPELVAAQLPSPAEQMCFRVVVRAVEGWLLADAESMASFLGTNARNLPMSPDDLRNPKQELLNIARRGHRRAVREDLLPAAGTTATLGPGYTARIIEFSARHWRPDAAADRSPILASCIRALARFK